MIADDIAAAKAAGAATPPSPTSNPLKLKKVAAELFATEGVETTDISYLQVSIAKLLAIAVKTRKVPTKETETYTGKDGTEKTRKVTEDKKVIQLTLDYDEFFASVTDAPTDYRVTNAEIPVGSIASRVVAAKKAKKAASPKASAATPAKAASAAAAAPDAPKKAKKAASPKRAKVADAAKALVMPVLTEEQLETLLKVRPPLAKKAHEATMKELLVKMGVEEKDFKQARADWVAYRADHEPPALLDDAKMEHLRVLESQNGKKLNVRTHNAINAFKEWGIAKADYKQATMEYKAWAKENGVESAKASPKAKSAAAPAAPPAIRSPTANPFEGSDDEEEEDETETPVSDAGEAHETALEAIGDAEDIGAWD
jgi:hypothetical protein